MNKKVIIGIVVAVLIIAAVVVTIVLNGTTNAGDKTNTNGNTSAVTEKVEGMPQKKDSGSTQSNKNDATDEEIQKMFIETQNQITDAVNNKLNVAFLSDLAIPIDEIPPAYRDEENWVYAISNGMDPVEILGGEDRTNINIENVERLSSTNNSVIYRVDYTFTTKPLEENAKARDGRTEAIMRVTDGKIIQYSEGEAEWL